MSDLETKYFEKIRLSFPEKFINDRQIRLLINSCPDQEHLHMVVQYLGQLLQSNSDQKTKGALLFELCDESHYDLAQWIEAIKVFKDYLDKEGRATKFEHLLEYIGCSCESPENKLLKYRLPDLVDKMLTEYGYVG